MNEIEIDHPRPQDKLRKPLINISPNGKYLVIYDEEGKKFVGWNVEKDKEHIQVGVYVVHEKDELEGNEKENKQDGENGSKYSQDRSVKVDNKKRIRYMCISDDKILAYIYDCDSFCGYIEIIDMNECRKIKLDFEFDNMVVQLCNFNLKGKLILWCTGRTSIKYNDNGKMNIVCVYSIQDGKTECQKIYTIPKEAKVINISKNDKIWLYLNQDLYEWNILTAYTIIILKNIYRIRTKDIKISNNEEYTCLKLSDEKIIVYSNQLEYPIGSFDLYYLNDLRSKDKRDKLIKQLHNLMINYSSLKCLLLLLDDTCLNELIEDLSNHSDQSNENSSNHSNQSNENSSTLFYCFDSNPPNLSKLYRFVHHDNHIKVDELQVKKKLEANDYESKHLKFSELKKDVLGKYQLEKGSIIWKFRIEGLEEQDISIEELEEKVSIKELKLEIEGKTDMTVENLNKKMNVVEIKESVVKFIDWTRNDKQITKFKKKLENLIKKIEITKIKVLNEDPADDFIEYIKFKFEELEKGSKLTKIIHDIRNAKIEKLSENIKEITEDTVNKLINYIVILKINEELVKDSITKLKKSEIGNSIWNWIELRRDFITRINKINELEKTNKFEIEINEKSLLVDKDLIPLFCNNSDLHRINILAGKLINDNEIAILTNIGFFIFNLNKDVRINYNDHENEKLISLNYFYYIQKICKNFEYDELVYGWVSYVKNNDEGFLKHGTALLSFAILMNDLELIDNIYKKCLTFFNQDLENNRVFLSIITNSMPLMNVYCPEYIIRFSLDTNMIIDSPDYKIELLNTSHLYPLSNRLKIVNLTPSILWTKYAYNMRDSNIIQFLMSLIFTLTLPISFPIFHILSYHNIINEIFANGISKLYYKYYYFISGVINGMFPENSKPTITFIIPYIKFVSYPNDDHYSWKKLCWWKELIKPKPSPFVVTINRSIYKTWSGEALVNFKWNLYGKYYHYAIWIVFTAFHICFTASTILESISYNIRDKLLIASIILGLFHFSFELRQFINNPIKWIFDPWNYFELMAYLCPTFTSIYLYTNNEAYFFISISYLLLDIKFLFFFRVFESFGIYYIIFISVAKNLAAFLVILFISLLSFAHAFFILLRPRDIYSLEESPSEVNNDPNNPWNLVNVDEKPDANTNMFTDYGTSLLAMYLFLLGNTDSLTNKWEYKNNPSLIILMVLFSLFIVLYLMNLLISLFTNVIAEDNIRSSFFMHKAKILAEIELFYLFPNQRRWKIWFPEVIYYHANVDKTRREINEQIKNSEWNSTEFLMLKKKLLNNLKIHNNYNEGNQN